MSATRRLWWSMVLIAVLAVVAGAVVAVVSAAGPAQGGTVGSMPHGASPATARETPVTGTGATSVSAGSVVHERGGDHAGSGAVTTAAHTVRATRIGPGQPVYTAGSVPALVGARPITVVADGAGGTSGNRVAGAVGTAPVGDELEPAPAAPAALQVTATATAVTVDWVDGWDPTSGQRDLVTGFVVYKRSYSGAWTSADVVSGSQLSSSPAHVYSFTDTATDVSDQCYEVAAVDWRASYSAEECVVRPDPDVFPQALPQAAVQWYGLSSTPGRSAALTDVAHDGDDLRERYQTFGANLGWFESPDSDVRLYRPGSNPEPIMYGEKVAIYFLGGSNGGYLDEGFVSLGSDLTLSSTPAYDWYVLPSGGLSGPGGAGEPVGDGEFALWNAKEGDYLVYDHQIWGVSLNWYQKTLPPVPSTSGPAPTGVRAVVVDNCVQDPEPLQMAVEDLTAGGGLAGQGTLQSQWVDGGCPGYGTTPWSYTLATGHQYLIEALDTTGDCASDPDASCVRLQLQVRGDSTGPVATEVVS